MMNFMEFLSPFFQNLIREYSASHTEPRNRWVHVVGIPMIMIGSLGLLGRLNFHEGIRLDLVLWAVVGAFYLKNARWMAFPFVLALLLLCVLSQFVGLHTLWLLFGMGWILQLVGHFAFEHVRPSFLDNLIHLFIGPFWLYCFLLRRTPGYQEIFSTDQG